MRARYAVLLAAVVLGGCDTNLGVAPVLNVGKVSASIARQTRRAAAVPARVTCPDQVELKKGHHFSCYAHFAVGRIRIKVMQIDKAGHVRYDYPEYRILDTPKLALGLERHFSAQLHRRVIVVCPQPVIERAHQNFTCLSAARDGTERKIVVYQRGPGKPPLFVIKKGEADD